MIYLTQTHQTPPRHVQTGEVLTPTAPLIQREDTSALAALGIYPHVTAPGDAPLGYTAWEFDGTQYNRAPAGTESEREEATDQQRKNSLSCTRLQARLECIERDIWDQIQTWATSQDPATQAYFEDAPNWRYTDERLQSGASALGLDDAALVEILEAAAQL